MFILSVRSRKYEDLYILNDPISAKRALKDHHEIEDIDLKVGEQWFEEHGCYIILLPIVEGVERHYELNL